MLWVYVIKNDDNGDIYVGETKRLFRRCNEHQTGRGGVNTSNSEFNRLIGLYKVSSNIAFLSYKESFEQNSFQEECEIWDEEDKSDSLQVERHITERYIYEYRNTGASIRGGPYTTYQRYNNFRFGNNFKDVSIDRPLCDCGYPCEVKIQKDKQKVWFVCPLPKNWDDFYEGVDRDDPCDFWQEFVSYRSSREKYLKQNAENDKNKSERIKKQCEFWVRCLPKYNYQPCMKCDEGYTPLWSRGNKYAICEDCFHSNYEELKKEYIDKPNDIRHIFADTIES